MRAQIQQQNARFVLVFNSRFYFDLYIINIEVHFDRFFHFQFSHHACMMPNTAQTKRLSREYYVKNSLRRVKRTLGWGYRIFALVFVFEFVYEHIAHSFWGCFVIAYSVCSVCIFLNFLFYCIIKFVFVLLSTHKNCDWLCIFPYT